MNKYIDYLKDRVKDLPLLPGVYIMRDEIGTIIYIGKAKKLKNRVSQYFFDTAKLPKVQLMADSVKTFDYIIVNSELEALNLEANLINKHKPFYNILLKDDKNRRPFLKINLKQDFPSFEITRKIKRDGAKYFGPYFGSVNVKDLLNLINSTFSLKTCSLNLNNDKKAKRECLNYHLGLCDAPCVGKIDKKEYRQKIDNAIAFLNGDVSFAKNILSQKMRSCAESENYESAIVYRNNLNLIDSINNKLITELTTYADIDVFAYYSNGLNTVISVLVVRTGKIMGLNNFDVMDIGNSKEDVLTSFVSLYYPEKSTVPSEVIFEEDLGEVVYNYLNQYSKTKVKVTVPKIGIRKKLLDMAKVNAKEYLEKTIDKLQTMEQRTTGAVRRLKEKLNLPELPIRIEGYDISNISGTNMVASMVVFTNGEPNYSHYRKFKIRTVVGQNNDFECMHEVLTRRISELSGDDVSFSTRPNLILIDGGKGQLSFAYSVLSKNNINIPMISLAKKEEEIFRPGESESVKLSKDDYALRLLQRVRDESHRYAITFHRSLRNKNSLVSQLSKIPLIGKQKEIALLEYFKDINKIKNASITELTEVNGISEKLATNIYNYFHKDNIN